MLRHCHIMYHLLPLSVYELLIDYDIRIVHSFMDKEKCIKKNVIWQK